MVSDWLPITISLCALMIAAVTAYYNFLRRFRLDVWSAGRIRLVRIHNRGGSFRDSLFVTLVFVNRGVWSGAMINMGLVLKYKDSSVLLQALLENIDTNVTSQNTTARPLYSFPLVKDETVVKQIMFMEVDSSKFKWAVGPYNADIWIMTTNTPWKQSCSITFEVTNEDLAGISSRPTSAEFANNQDIWKQTDKQTRDTAASIDTLKKLLS